MPAEPVDVCIIEDDAIQRALLSRRMHDSGFSVIEAEDAESGLTEIRQHHPRVVISDLVLPGLNGTGLCQEIRADTALDGTYIIMVTACPDRDVKNQVLSAGADDYLLKPYDGEELIARLGNGLRINKLQERLRHAALTDGLTGLWNHSQFRQLLDREVARTRRYGGVASLLMLDLDHFKAINDTYGHETGNRVLQGMARHLLAMVRDTDVVARYGGEEFTVICPETPLQEAAQLADRIRQTIPERVRVPNCDRLRVTASFGVSATNDARVTSVHDLVNVADQALYVGKRQGRNRVVCSDQIPDTPPPVDVEHTEVDRLRKEVVSLSMQSKELCLQSVWALVQALEARDRFTAWHSRNTTFYAARLAAATELPEPLQTAVSHAAMLHDLGKIGVPDQILQSRHPLTESQAAVLRQVPLMTCKILEPLRVFETETLVIRHLRERFDGTGHPLGLARATIPVGSRLLAVAETFDALTSERPHRSSVGIDEALRIIESEAGRQFDPQFTELLARVLASQRDCWSDRIRRARAELLNSETSATHLLYQTTGS